eukprot:1630749-Amphidinium_carterae.1
MSGNTGARKLTVRFPMQLRREMNSSCKGCPLSAIAVNRVLTIDNNCACSIAVKRGEMRFHHSE